MQVIEKKISDLIPYGNNPRLNDGAVDAVMASIKEFKFRVPIIVDKNNVIIAGHTRLKAAQKLKLKTVPVIIADDLTPEQVKAFRLADNKVGELAGWDFEKLDLELAEIDLDMTQFGFGDEDATGTEDGAPVINTETNFNYKEQYGVIVMCADESEQEQTYNRLTEEGYSCKVVAV